MGQMGRGVCLCALVCDWVCVCVCLYVCLSMYLWIYVSVCLHESVCTAVGECMCVFVCISEYISLCLYCLIYMCVSLCVFTCMCVLIVYLYTQECVFLYVSVCLCVYVSVYGLLWSSCRLGYLKLFSIRAWLRKAPRNSLHQVGRADTKAAAHKEGCQGGDSLGTKSPVPKIQTWFSRGWLPQYSFGSPVSTTADSQPWAAKIWKLADVEIPRCLTPAT